MSFADLILTRLAEEPRDRALSGILRAVARAIESGAEVEPEPVRRDAAGRPVRSRPLDLPQRADFALRKEGRTLLCRVEAEQEAVAPADGSSVLVTIGDGFLAEIGPLAWDAMALTLDDGAGTPDWRRLRHWFLEWFQGRHTDVSPELLGAVHGIEGPRRVGEGWRLVIDLGSAPPAALGELLVALSETGASRVRIGRR